jgi:hypothetical protein
MNTFRHLEWPLLSAALAFAMFLGTGSSQTNRIREAKRFRLSSRFDLLLDQPEPAKLGEKLAVTVHLRNRSTKPTYATDAGSLIDYDLVLVDGSGNELERTEEGKQLIEDGGASTRVIGVNLAPGEELKSEIPVSTVYKLAKKGVFYLRVMRIVGWDSKEGYEKVISNPVKLQISD